MTQNWVSQVVSSLVSMWNENLGKFCLENYSWNIAITQNNLCECWQNCTYKIHELYTFLLFESQKVLLENHI